MGYGSQADICLVFPSLTVEGRTERVIFREKVGVKRVTVLTLRPPEANQAHFRDCRCIELMA